MSDLSVTILPETPKDAQAIERLLERTFGPGRFVLSAYRIREHVETHPSVVGANVPGPRDVTL